MSWSRHGALALVALLLCASVVVAASPQPIGLAASESNFAAGTSSVRGQATLFDGDAVRSQFLPTRLHLRGGSRYVLGIASEGSIYRDHLLLRSGSAEVASSGRTSRLVASSISVTADEPGTSATVYAARDGVTVLVRKGEVKIGRLGSARVTTLGAGRSATLRVNGREGLTMDSDSAVVEASRIQANQIARLSEATKNYTCLETKANSLSRTYSSLSSQLAVAQATRSAIQQRIDTGAATPADMRQMSSINDNMRSMTRTSFALSEDLGGVILQHHPGPGHDVSSHTIHGHTTPEHHGQHGHSAPPPHGHMLPPHHIPGAEGP
jgi:hypothetical protein